MANQATQVAPELATVSSETQPAHEDIAALAYRLWQENSCPDGTYEEDWFRAEQELTANRKVAVQASRG